MRFIQRINSKRNKKKPLRILGKLKSTVSLENDIYFLKLVASGYFSVLKSGTIINTKTGNKVGRPEENGYIKISHRASKIKVRHMWAHRLVFLVHNNNMKPSPYLVNHKDANKGNNKSSNLEKSTQWYNVHHYRELGLQKKSGKSRRFDEKTQKQIIKLSKIKGNTQVILAERFKCSPWMIHDILKRSRLNDLSEKT